jgi:ornithine carbamoyltransferase
MIAGAMAGMDVRVASPPGFAPSDAGVDRAQAHGSVMVTNRPAEAVKGADVVYTDVWASMGREAEAAERRRAFEGFTVDARLMDLAADKAIFLHCLPAHRGDEVAGEVVDGAASHVFLQAENRMHAARGLLLFLMGER